MSRTAVRTGLTIAIMAALVSAALAVQGTAKPLSQKTSPKSAQKLAPKKAVQNSTSKLIQKPATKSVTKPVAKPSSKPGQKSAQKPAQKSVQKPATALSPKQVEDRLRKSIGRMEVPIQPSVQTSAPTQTIAQAAPQASTPVVSPTTTPPAPVAQTNPAPAATPTPTPQTPKPRAPRKLSNVFVDSDAKTVIQEITNASGASILADSSVKGTEINFSLKNDTVESALDKFSVVLGLVWKKKGDMSLLSTGAPGTPLFEEFAITKTYVPKTQAADSLFALLSQSYKLYATLDKSANLISITAPEAKVNAAIAALESADGPRKQFIVEALVTEISNQVSTQTGFSWSWRYFASDASSGLTYGIASAADVVSIKNLIGGGKAKLKANPQVMAIEGREASLTVGNESYFPMVSGNSSYSTVTFQRINTGITLKFTGYIDGDQINLHMQPEVSDAVTSVAGNPTTTVRRADTYIRVKFGETVALGGLVQEKETRQDSKIPFLGDIPLLGKVFQNSSRSTVKSETVILLTPKLVEMGAPISK